MISIHISGVINLVCHTSRAWDLDKYSHLGVINLVCHTSRAWDLDKYSHLGVINLVCHTSRAWDLDKYSHLGVINLVCHTSRAWDFDKHSGTSLIRSSKMRTPPSTGHHQESSYFCFVCFCQINLGRVSSLYARMTIIKLFRATLYNFCFNGFH